MKLNPLLDLRHKTFDDQTKFCKVQQNVSDPNKVYTEDTYLEASLYCKI